jgi:hypothetical protein
MGCHDYTLVAISSTAMSLRFTHSSAPDLEMHWQVDREESAPCPRQPRTCKGETDRYILSESEPPPNGENSLQN